MTTIAPSAGLILGTAFALASWAIAGFLLVRWTRLPQKPRRPDEVGFRAAATVGAFILLAGIVLGGWKAFMIATKNAPAIKTALTLWSLGAVVAWILLVGVGLATHA